MHHLDIGRHGEAIAASYFVERGYRIIEKNVRLNFGEIDLIVSDGQVLRIVEVKSRCSDKYGKASESLTQGKIGRLKRMMAWYINNRYIEEQEISLDLLAIEIDKNAFIHIEWIQNITL